MISHIFVNHEKIHEKQQMELLIIPFLIWYLIEYLLLRLKYAHDKAYRNIVFEREAYAMDNDLCYIENRKPWAFLKFYNLNYRV